MNINNKALVFHIAEFETEELIPIERNNIYKEGINNNGYAYSSGENI